MRARKKKNCDARLERCSDYIVEKIEIPEGNDKAYAKAVTYGGAFNLVAKTFTLVDLTQVYEVVLGKKMYKNALKRDRVGDKLEPTGELMKPITSQRSTTAYRYRKNT